MINHPYSLRNSLAPVFLALFFITVFYAQSSAQNAADKNEDKISSPADEEFLEVDALASPWWSSGCISGVDRKLQDPNCKTISGYFSDDALLSLYDPDGSVWYAFSLWEESPDYFVKYRQVINQPEFIKYRRAGFSPLATPGVWFPHAVVLRMVGESPHWYKVEVNEETRDVRYILKSDPLWVKKSWDYWLFRGDQVAGSNYFLADKERALLRDKPDGKVIEDPDAPKTAGLRIFKVDGEWAYVQTPKTSGWIRWRKGRDMLLRSTFTELKVSPPDSTDNNGSASLSRPQ